MAPLRSIEAGGRAGLAQGRVWRVQRHLATIINQPLPQDLGVWVTKFHGKDMGVSQEKPSRLWIIRRVRCCGIKGDKCRQIARRMGGKQAIVQIVHSAAVAFAVRPRSTHDATHW